MQNNPPLIDPTAIIEQGAIIDDGVKIGAYAYIGKDVKIAKGTIVHHHATVEGNTTIGQNNEIFPYALVGGKTHDLKYDGGNVGLIIGQNNTIREYVTIHMATIDSLNTIIGDNNNFLAYAHIAHDCILGNNIVISASAALGGHCEVYDFANIGWNSGVHQFCKVGSYAMLAANSLLVKDLPPCMIADAHHAQVKAINKIGIERRGFSEEEINATRSAWKILYHKGLNRLQAIETMETHQLASTRPFQLILDFAKKSTRGLA